MKESPAICGRELDSIQLTGLASSNGIPQNSRSLLSPEFHVLIPTSQIETWRDLQDKVAMFFSEMGYKTTTPYTIDLAGRGKKEVDVYILDPRASVNEVYLVECKYWGSAIPQEVVHAFHTVMVGAGANTGFIIGKVGFQSGAHEAALRTNIHLLTWEELQHKFGLQWFSHKCDQREKLIAEIRQIDRIYMDQFSPGTIFNIAPFSAAGKLVELRDVIANLRIALMASIGIPRGYDDPGPIDVMVYPGFAGATEDKYGVSILRLTDVRAYFDWHLEFSRECLENFRELRDNVHRIVGELPDSGAAAMEQAVREIVEESPIRSFRDEIGEDMFERLIGSRISSMRGKV